MIGLLGQLLGGGQQQHHAAAAVAHHHPQLHPAEAAIEVDEELEDQPQQQQYQQQQYAQAVQQLPPLLFRLDPTQFCIIATIIGVGVFSVGIPALVNCGIYLIKLRL